MIELFIFLSRRTPHTPAMGRKLLAMGVYRSELLADSEADAAAKPFRTTLHRARRASLLTRGEINALARMGNFHVVTITAEHGVRP